MNNESCDRCELDFGTVREDGSLVVRPLGIGMLCMACATIRENAEEQAWIDHEKAKAFG